MSKRLAVAFLMDAWIPAVFTRVSEPLAVPTVDLSVHFRASLPRPDSDWFLGVYRTGLVADGASISSTPAPSPAIRRSLAPSSERT